MKRKASDTNHASAPITNPLPGDAAHIAEATTVALKKKAKVFALTKKSKTKKEATKQKKDFTGGKKSFNFYFDDTLIYYSREASFSR